jgi:hypothetical protein
LAAAALIAVVVGVTATVYTAGLLAALGAILLILLAVKGGHWPLTIIFVWIGALGTSLASGIRVGSVEIAAAYALLGSLTLVGALQSALHRSATRQLDREVTRLLTMVVVPVAIVAAHGMLAGNDTDQLRKEAVLWAAVAAAGVLTLTSMTRRALVGLAAGLLVAGFLAAAKSIAIAVTGTVLNEADSMAAYSAVSTVNPQFETQRVILQGGDTLNVLAVPVALAFLRTGQRRVAILIILALPVIVLGLVLSYTRTMIAAAVIGAAVVYMQPVAGRKARWGTVGGLILAAFITVILLNLSFGQSQFTAGDALIRRFVGGQDVSASALSERIDDLVAAVGDPGTLLFGRGLGGTFVSPITPLLGSTGYVHVGYGWLLLKGGVVFTAMVASAMAWTALGLARRVRHSDDGYALSALVGCIVAFAAINVLVARFATIEGAIFLGVTLAVGIVVRRSDSSHPPMERASARHQRTPLPDHQGGTGG